jgi:hypothetical protein
MLCPLSGEMVPVSPSQIVIAGVVLTRSPELVGPASQNIITTLKDIEREVWSLRQNFDGNGPARLVQSESGIADELLVRHRSLMDVDGNGRLRGHRRDVHPCRGGLQLIKGDDRGGIDRCLRNDLTITEQERLSSGGTYLYWACDSCEFRIKYFVSRSRAATLLSNDDYISFKDLRIRCSRAFLAMSHLEQTRRLSSLHNSPRYTCLLCALHRPAARTGRAHTFSTREDYATHIQDVHIDGSLPPAFVLQKLCIENGERLPEGKRRHLWVV